MNDIRPSDLNSEEEINLLDYLKVLVKHKMLIMAIVGVALIVSVIYSFSLPNIYSANVSIFPPQQDGGSAGIGMASLSGGLGGVASGFLGIKSPADIWISILKSRRLKDAIITRFDLLKVYKKKTFEDMRIYLSAMVNIVKSKDDIISITVEDKNPEVAALLANAFVEELDKINKELRMSSGKRMRVFVEERFDEVKMELLKTEDALKEFQEKNKAVSIDSQTIAVMSAIGSINGQIMAKEVELQTLLSYATPYNPNAKILNAELDELKEKMKDLEEGKRRTNSSSPKDIFIPTTKIPDISLQYVRLLRNAKVQETLYTLLSQQYEMARIQEAKDMTTVQVLDVAKTPEKKSKPNKRQIVMLAAISSLFLAVFVAFFIEYLERMKKRQAEKKVGWKK